MTTRLVTVRAVRVGDESQLRALRLRALAESPDAFAASAESQTGETQGWA